MSPGINPELSSEATRGTTSDGTERSGIYWKPTVWALARSAYVADLDRSRVSGRVRRLARSGAREARCPYAVAASCDRGGPQLGDAAGAGANRSHPLRTRTIQLVEEAVLRDRLELGRVVSRSAFAAEAVVAAAKAARERLGRPLPPPPIRLSNRPPRRRPPRVPGRTAAAG